MITFRNLIQTNDYSVEFIFKKKSNKTSSSTDKVQNVLTPKVFAEEIMKNEALVLGVDSSITDAFIAVNSSSSSSKEKIRKTLTKQYYHICGFNLATKVRMQHQQHNRESF
jgi:DNA-dependent RNA polymerase auxiliary subunit epsilon